MKKHLIIISIFTALIFACTAKVDSNKTLLQVHAILGDPFAGSVVVYLTNESRDQYLSMAIAGDQALSIYYAQNAIQPPRPMTHDLFSKLIDTLNYRIEYIDITSIKEETYYSEIHFKGGENTFVLDARPSDAIALALRQGAPIYSHPQILQPIRTKARDFAGTQQLDAIKFGLTVQNLTPSMQKFFKDVQGLIITEVRPDSRAEKAGLQEGDIITSWDSISVTDSGDFAEILRGTGSNSIEIEVLRGGEKQIITL